MKAYEFSQFSCSVLDEAHAFHFVGGLRSICEDLILLKYLSSLRIEDQDILIQSNMHSSISDAIKRQEPFFSTFRPSQPVLNNHLIIDQHLKLEAKVLGIWRANGWPDKTDKKWPPTEQLARKVGPGTVDVIYDYIFRLTSGTVHFSTRALLRTGWGPRPSQFTFSTKHMGKYYADFCKIYSIFLLTVYFEFFGTSFKTDGKTKKAFKDLRRSLATGSRWPEMVTFEELNLKVPKMNIWGLVAQVIIAEEIENGFIAAAEKKASVIAGGTDSAGSAFRLAARAKPAKPVPPVPAGP